jgi:small neutral amino acid transporter SnatA (MarC family)
MMIHPVTMVLFIIALIVSWRTERKKHVLYSLIVYVVILATTFAWFVPELLSLINTPYSDTYDASLTSRGSRWEILSIIRGIVLFVTAIFLYMGLTKSAVKHVTA